MSSPPRTDDGEETVRDFYVIPADTPEAIQDKLLRVVTERIPQRFGLHPIQVKIRTDRDNPIGVDGPAGFGTVNEP